MYQFHYGTIGSSFDCRLLYSDTNSLLIGSFVKISTVKEAMFSISVTSQITQKITNCTAKKINSLKFKEKFAGDNITEFICLKPKLEGITSTREYFTFNHSKKTSKVPAQLYDCLDLIAFFFS